MEEERESVRGEARMPCPGKGQTTPLVSDFFFIGRRFSGVPDAGDNTQALSE